MQEELLNKYNATQYKDQPVYIITDPQVLASMVEYLDLDEDSIRNCVPLVLEADRLKLLAGEDAPVNLVDCSIAKSKTLWRNGKYQPSTGFKIFPYASQVGRLNSTFNINYLKKGDASLLLREDYVFEDGKPRPFPLKLATVNVKQGFTFVIVLQSLLEKYVGKTIVTTDNKPRITYNPKVRKDLERDKGKDGMLKELVQLYQYFPEQVKQMLDTINQLQEYSLDSLVRGDRDTPITPMANYPVTNAVQVFASNPNPTPQELTTEGNYEFILGNIPNTEAQILVEKQQQNPIMNLLLECYKPNPNPEIYKIFSASENLISSRYGYVTEDAVKLYVKIIAEATNTSLSQLREILEPLHDFPHWGMIPRIKGLEQPTPILNPTKQNALVQAVQHYSETGKGISYLHFRTS